MSDDLIRRLRSDEPEYAVRRSHLLEAADLIERLQGELADTIKALGEAADIIVDLRGELDAAQEGTTMTAHPRHNDDGKQVWP